MVVFGFLPFLPVVYSTVRSPEAGASLRRPSWMEKHGLLQLQREALI